MCDTFTADIVLDETPWLNSTTACTFPEPFFSQPDAPDPAYTMVRGPVRNRFPSENIKTRETTSEQTERLLGQYGNFVYGNVTIVQDDVTGILIAQFDVFDCTLWLNWNNVTYWCQGRQEFWFVTVYDFRFDSVNSPAEYVDIAFWSLSEGQVRFERDLNINEAPGPRDHWPTCEEVFPDN